MNNPFEMKIIKTLEDFNEESVVFEAITPEKAKFRFDISGSQKKVAKINKTFIDIHQLLIEMSDEIVALKLSYDNLDSEAMKTINHMEKNINNLISALKHTKADGTETGMVQDSAKLERNLARLKTGFLKKKGA